ncbi:MAG: pentapeptide repeat-containing protein [Fimbriimonadaceae bacterium]|nr:pentapeptide repeat-containing protein [Fimbriimonadaceae bacterium]
MANLDEVKLLLRTKSCPLGDLREADLSRADLGKADLYHADLSGAVLREANLQAANLTGAKLVGADLTGANLRFAKLVGTDLSDAVLAAADLRGAVLSDAVLTKGALESAVRDEPTSVPTTAERRVGLLGSEVRLSTLCLVTVGLFDLVTTVVFLAIGGEEGNPLFAGLFEEYGPLGLVLGKVVFLAGPVLLLEYVRTKSPTSAEQGTWVAFLAYLALYGTHLVTLRG